MANMTNYLENKIVNSLVGAETYSFPSTLFLALFTGDPTETGSVANELSGGGYVRVPLTGKFGIVSGTDGKTSNTAAIVFPQTTATWTNITHVGIAESVTAGTADLLLYKVLLATITIESGFIFEFDIGDFVITAG